jgi:transketolase
MEREQAIRNAMMWTEEASKLKKELDDMRSERNAIEDELTAAKSNIEWERVKHKQQKESKEHWKAKAEESQADIEQWKALYIEQLNRANRFEELHQRMTKRPRDPKTGRFYSAKPRPTAQEMNEGLAAFDAMMGNAIEQLQGLTVRKLCDEVRENANEEI